jgi:hypothetical protein
MVLLFAVRGRGKGLPLRVICRCKSTESRAFHFRVAWVIDGAEDDKGTVKSHPKPTPHAIMSNTTRPSKLFNDDLDFALQMVYEGFKPDIPTGVYVNYDKVEVLEREHNRFRPITDAEWNSIAYDAPEIKLSDSDDSPFYQTFTAPNGKNFTVRELVQVVEKYEQGARNREFEDDYEWEAFDGIDNHHIYFEGLKGGKDGVWYIFWGS